MLLSHYSFSQKFKNYGNKFGVNLMTAARLSGGGGGEVGGWIGGNTGSSYKVFSFNADFHFVVLDPLNIIVGIKMVNL